MIIIKNKKNFNVRAQYPSSILFTSLVLSLPLHFHPFFLSLGFSHFFHLPLLFPAMFPFFRPSLLSLFNGLSWWQNLTHLDSAAWHVHFNDQWNVQSSINLLSLNNQAPMALIAKETKTRLMDRLRDWVWGEYYGCDARGLANTIIETQHCSFSNSIIYRHAAQQLHISCPTYCCFSAHKHANRTLHVLAHFLWWKDA